MSSRPQSQVRGFTLVEVLVALALMSLITTILLESVRVGGHAWQRVTRQAASVDEIARAQSFLRESLGTLYPPQSSSGSFVGESDTLEFSSIAPGHSRGALVRYRLELSSTQPGDVDIRYRGQSAEFFGSPGSSWSSERLVARVHEVAIQFWEDSTSSQGRWVTHWADPTKLPRLIRVDVLFADNDPRRWPPLYVEPRIDTRASCSFDVVSRRCRAGT